MNIFKKIKKSWVYAFLALAMVAYIVTMLTITLKREETRMCSGVIVTVHDTAQYRFVSPAELAQELGSLTIEARNIPMNSIDNPKCNNAFSLLLLNDSFTFSSCSMDSKPSSNVKPMFCHNGYVQYPATK